MRADTHVGELRLQALIGLERSAAFTRDQIDEPKTRIVERLAMLRPRVAEPDDEFDDVRHARILPVP